MAKDLSFEAGNPAPGSAGRQALADQRANRLVEQAKQVPLTDGGVLTDRLLTQALTHAPHHHEARILRERLYQMFVPRWHFPMMADTTRNQAYAAAIAAKVKPGDVVLDIGCGAGLTAMMAARAGAKHVYSCEQQPLIAQAARRVIAANGLNDRITVLAKPSQDLVVGVDLPEHADVVISEIVDTMLLGEGALATLAHAMAHLAKPGAVALPECGTLKAQAIESDALAALWHPETAMGFDLSPFHRFANVAQITPNDLSACPVRALGPARDLFHFDLTHPKLKPARHSTTLHCTQAGRLHAVLVYFEMRLAPGIMVNNAIGMAGHWGRTAFLLPQTETVQPGAKVAINAAHDCATLSLSTAAVTQAVAQPVLAEAMV